MYHIITCVLHEIIRTTATELKQVDFMFILPQGQRLLSQLIHFKYVMCNRWDYCLFLQNSRKTKMDTLLSKPWSLVLPNEHVQKKLTSKSSTDLATELLFRHQEKHWSGSSSNFEWIFFLKLEAFYQSVAFLICGNTDTPRTNFGQSTSLLHGPCAMQPRRCVLLL